MSLTQISHTRRNRSRSKLRKRSGNTRKSVDLDKRRTYHEHTIGKGEVVGSVPTGSTIKIRNLVDVLAANPAMNVSGTTHDSVPRRDTLLTQD